MHANLERKSLQRVGEGVGSRGISCILYQLTPRLRAFVGSKELWQWKWSGCQNWCWDYYNSETESPQDDDVEAFNHITMCNFQKICGESFCDGKSHVWWENGENSFTQWHRQCTYFFTFPFFTISITKTNNTIIEHMSVHLFSTPVPTMNNIYMWASALCIRFNSNPAPGIRSMQFHYCTVSNLGTRADDAFCFEARCVA